MKATGGAQVAGELRRAARWLATVSYLALSACSGAHEPVHTPTASRPRGIITPTTNVPALVGASIDGLRRRLGSAYPLPPNFDDPIMAAADSSAAPDSVMAFRTGGLLLVANYNAHTRQVRDLLLLGRHEDSLLAKASLQTSGANYLVLPVFQAGSANRMLGLRVIATK